MSIVYEKKKFVVLAVSNVSNITIWFTGYEPLPRSGYKKTSNGCGSFDFIFDDSPDSLIHVEKEFISCCNQHDECYE